MSWKFVERCEGVLKVFEKDGIFLIEVSVDGNLVNEFTSKKWRALKNESL